MKNVTFIASASEYSRFLSFIVELNKISETHKIIFNYQYKNKSHILLYSINSEKVMNNETILDIKTFLLDIKTVFTNADFEDEIHMTIIQAKEWLKKFKFVDSGEEVSISIDYEDKLVKRFEVKDKYVEISAIAGINQLTDLTQAYFTQKLSTLNSEAIVELTADEFKKLKKLSKLEANELILLKYDSKNQSFQDEFKTWKMSVNFTKTPDTNTKYLINKKHLDNITANDSNMVTMYFLGEYVIVDEPDSKLLFTLDLEA